MKKAILYIRVSTDEQAERGHSLAYQEEKLRMYCQIKGIEAFRLFKEDYSAKTFERPVFRELLSFIKKNKNEVDELLFIKWDRFSRNAGDAYQMIKELHKLGVVPHAIEQPLDLSVPENKTMLALYLTIPEVENDRRALNVISGMRRARKDGKFLGIAPVGYNNMRDDRNKPIIVPDDEMAPLVVRAFEETARGIKPVFTILQELRTDGFVCSKSNFWNVLNNPVYYGGIVIPAYRDEKYEIAKGTHDALISKELFDDVQDILHDRKRTVPTNNTRREELPLRGILKCEKCGKLMTGSATTNRHKTKYFYYHCTKGCPERFKADVVNNEFLEVLKAIKPDPLTIKLFKEGCKEVVKVNEKDRLSLRANIEKEIEKQNGRLKNAQEMLLDGVIPAEDYKDIKANIELEIIKLKRELLSYSSIDSQITEYAEYAANLLQNIDSMYLSANLQTKNMLLGWMFPEKIVFTKSGVRTLKLNEALSMICSVGEDHKENKNGLSSSKTEKSTCVTRPGFEPRLTVPKTAVLPLHHQAITGCKYKKVLKFNKYKFKCALKFAVLPTLFPQRYCVC